MKTTDVKIADKVKITNPGHFEYNKILIVSRIDLKSEYPFGFWDSIHFAERTDFKIIETGTAL